MPSKFDYQEAFSRNIGWVTEWEQQQLRGRKVAIAGMGGVGGAHLLTLARLGIGSFHIADMDHFELANMNRQVGAAMSTLDCDKTEIMAGMARDINPELDMGIFSDGISENNIDEFLAGVDLFVDGFDFFVLDIRRKVFARCRELSIPAITAAPIGFGAAYIIFMPNGMSFEDYFRFEGLSQDRQYVNFAVGLTPKGFHRSYLVDPSRLNMTDKRAPSTVAGIQLCAGIVGAEAVKILLGRGKLRAAPWHHQFDAFQGNWKQGYLPFGNGGPLQKLKRHIGYKAFAVLSRAARPVEDLVAGSEMEQILDLARWAPSGDNSQPWQFEIHEPDSVTVTIHVEGPDRNIYDFNDGQPTLLSAGFLLETMRIAATRFGRGMAWDYLGPDGPDHRIDVSLPPQPGLAEDPLCPYIKTRSVDRRPYKRTRLTEQQKAELEQALGDDLILTWHESFSERLAMARLNARATDIRLRLKETYEVHKRILDWDNRFSRTGVPASAIGLEPATLKLMRWVMGTWSRVHIMNRFFAGTLAPRLQMDLVPGVGCAAHFTVAMKKQVEAASLLRSGERLQRFWLTATQFGLAVQPSLAPLCFSTYAKNGRDFEFNSGLSAKLGRLAQLVDGHGSRLVFTGRLGVAGPTESSSRSIRLKKPECSAGLARRNAKRVIPEPAHPEEQSDII